MTNTLESFTDVLGDEIGNSQPLSLPSSAESRGFPVSVNNNPIKTTNINVGVTGRPSKCTGQHGQFRSVEEIVAPVKALCTERLTEWYSKFTKLGLMCIEVTGDTDVDFTQLKPYKFGDECRPVKLKRIVEGYPCAEGTSIFKFDIILNYKLWPIIQKYHCGKPTLIFCNTRKSVILTAETLSRELTVSFNAEQKAKLTALASTIKNKTLQVN
ncbi:unnamed protein product [Spodoptera littoralis]|uniref:Uncharacterized protein n=1 Tax=Spodoptera littoralis TaxID=7109 RepID=A0A9P0I0U8_SPOLI|nr:unnamed protein product [Spodoptera littoralis]CAH1638108.1 unnamed protein product [Spodoptera littoralis]